MSGIEIHGTSEFHEGIILKTFADFPSDPKLDTVIIKDGLIWAYTDIGGVTGWNPVTGQHKSAHLHIQAVEATEWVVNHQQDSSDYLLVVYSDAGNVVSPASHQAVSDTQVLISFNAPTKGKALLFFATAIINPVVGSNYMTVQTKLTVENEMSVPSTDNIMVGDKTLTQIIDEKVASVATALAQSFTVQET